MDMLDRLLGHDQWATGKLLEASRDLSDESIDQPFEMGHGSLRETFRHMIFVVDGWTAQMVGRPPAAASIARSTSPTIADLITLHERFYPTFAEVARQMRDEQRLDETFIDEYGYPQSMGGTIGQVIHHNAQHRAEARHMLERLGVPDLWDNDPQEWEHFAGPLIDQNTPQS